MFGFKKRRNTRAIEKLKWLYGQLNVDKEIYDTENATKVFEIWYTDTEMRPQLSQLYGTYLYPILERLFKELRAKDTTIEDIERHQLEDAPTNTTSIADRNQTIIGCYALAFVVGPQRHTLYGAIMAKWTAKGE